MVELQRKIAAYRQLQHDTTAQLYSVASALLVHDERTLDATLRQLNQFGYDLDRLQFVAKDEVELLGQVRKDYDQFIQVVSQSVELIRAGKIAGRKPTANRSSQSIGRAPRAPDESTRQSGRSRHGGEHRSERHGVHPLASDRDRIRRRQHRAGSCSRLRDLLVGGRAGSTDGREV